MNNRTIIWMESINVYFTGVLIALGKKRDSIEVSATLGLTCLNKTLTLKNFKRMDGTVLNEKNYEQVLKEKNIALKRQIDKMDTELCAYRELAIIAVLTAGFNFDSKPYKELVRLVGIKTIILAKIQKGITLTEQEKEYLTKNLK